MREWSSVPREGTAAGHTFAKLGRVVGHPGLATCRTGGKAAILHSLLLRATLFSFNDTTTTTTSSILLLHSLGAASRCALDVQRGSHFLAQQTFLELGFTLAKSLRSVQSTASANNSTVTSVRQAHLIVVFCPLGRSERLLLLDIRLLARRLRRPRPRVRAPPRPLVASSVISSSPSRGRRP